MRTYPRMHVRIVRGARLSRRKRRRSRRRRREEEEKESRHVWRRSLRSRPFSLDLERKAEARDSSSGISLLPQAESHPARSPRRPLLIGELLQHARRSYLPLSPFPFPSLSPSNLSTPSKWPCARLGKLNIFLGRMHRAGYIARSPRDRRCHRDFSE